MRATAGFDVAFFGKHTLQRHKSLRLAASFGFATRNKFSMRGNDADRGR
jgi:hypothetical protein